MLTHFPQIPQIPQRKKKRLTTFPVISRPLFSYPPPTERRESPIKKAKTIVIRQKAKKNS
jgi:hypothetical protein